MRPPGRRSAATGQPAPPRLPVAALIGRSDLQSFVVHLRERGVKPVSCNSWLRVLNTFGGWLHTNGHVAERVRLRPQKLEKHLVPVHDERALLLRFKLKKVDHWRVCTIASTALAGFKSD